MTSVPNPSLNAGLAALKQGNYTDAIAHFESICETELDDTLVVKASKGLITAHRSLGNWEKAIALCQQLVEHPDVQTSDWARNALAKLRAEHPDSHPRADATGFVPLADTPPTSTGFVAFEETSPQRTSPKPRSTPSRTKPPRKPPSTQQPSQKQQPQTGSVSQLPIPYAPPPGTAPSLFTPRPPWRNRGRAERWRKLKPPKLTRLWLVQLATIVILFWGVRFGVELAMGATNTLLVYLPLLQPFPLLYRDPALPLGILLVLLLIGSPWLLDRILKASYGLEPFSLSQLASHSSEAAKLIQQVSRQRHLPIPQLRILPTDTPIALTYGNLPRTARIAVSEGLLAQLHEDEIATIYASQLGHIAYWDFILMSWGQTLLQIPYSLYGQVSQWGEQLPELIDRKVPASGQFLSPLFVGISTVVASVSYGIYWLLRLPFLWLSRVRVYYSDRFATDTTGNPNGLTRALLKIGLGMTDDIQTYRATSGLLASFDLLLPVGYRQALPLGSCSPQIPFAEVLRWDCTNPYRDWLILTAAHPLLGERLHLFARYAHFWTLGTELDLPPLVPPIRRNAARLSKLRDSYQALPLLESALLWGLLLGIGLRASLWLVGRISDSLDIWRLIWLHNADFFLDACVLVTFSLCIFLWINRYFPDIKPPAVQIEPNLGELLSVPDAVPAESQPVQLTGKLLGRSGLHNRLAQDLILQTSTGFIKLHFFSRLGSFGNLLLASAHPSELVNQQVTVSGWFRRGVTPWIDVETLRTSGGRVSRAHYPIWLTGLALAAAIWGAYLIWQA
jgi:Zn-dependent protease with chaperone function